MGCNHHNWIRSIQLGQFTWIRRKYTLDTDLYTQTDMMMERFEEKGYNRCDLENTRRQVFLKDQDKLLSYKRRIRKRISVNI